MLAILSPAKTLDYETPLKTKLNSQPIYGRESNQLIKTLRTFEPFEVASLMKISDKLADLNHKRYVEWRNKPAESKHVPRLWPLREMSIKASKRKVSMTMTLNSRRDTCAFCPGFTGYCVLWT